MNLAVVFLVIFLVTILAMLGITIWMHRADPPSASPPPRPQDPGHPPLGVLSAAGRLTLQGWVDEPRPLDDTGPFHELQFSELSVYGDQYWRENPWLWEQAADRIGPTP